jgi:hypothetical protein
VGLAELHEKLPAIMDAALFFVKKPDDVVSEAELDWRLATGDKSHTVTDPKPDELYQWVCTRLSMLEPIRVCQALVTMCRMDYLTDTAIHLWKYCVSSKQVALERLLSGPQPLQAMRPVNLLECFETSDSLE